MPKYSSMAGNPAVFRPPGSAAATFLTAAFIFTWVSDPASRFTRFIGSWASIRPTSTAKIDIYSRFIHPQNGSHIDVTRDLDRFAAVLGELSPPDSRLVGNLVAGAKAFGRADFLAPMEKPPEMQSAWDLAKMVFRTAGTLKYYRGRYNQPISATTNQLQHPWLKEIWDHIFLPDVPVWFVMVILGMLHAGNMALRLDGSAGFARALERRFLDLGGDITYGATVTGIRVENDRAVGVRLAGKKFCRVE
jgi:phytoene dehydrogenase-like protein